MEEEEMDNNTLRACFSLDEDIFNNVNEEFSMIDANKREKILWVLQFLNNSKNSFSTADADEMTKIQWLMDAENEGFLEPIIQLYKKGQEFDDSIDTCSEPYEGYDEEFLWKTSRVHYQEDHNVIKEDKFSRPKLSPIVRKKYSKLNF
jgi:hypothetical protein